MFITWEACSKLDLKLWYPNPAKVEARLLWRFDQDEALQKALEKT